jgi:hypothetical protein
MREEDILARHSRPQKHSTWVPKTRDWRYATGVFKHNDFEDAPKDRSAWDAMDFDYQASRSRSGTGIEDGGYMSVDGMVSAPDIPEGAKSKISPETSKTIVRIEPVKKKAKTGKRSRTPWQKRYRKIGEPVAEGEPRYEVVGLIARLRFSGKLIIEDAPPHPAIQSPPEHTSILATPAKAVMHRDPDTSATARTAQTLNTLHILDSIESVHEFPVFQRTWVDETKDFNTQEVRARLRQPGAQVKDMGNNYAWYDDAVPIDALFPPGIPLSAKEVNAYYPHHIRWKQMMLRLTNNDYRGADFIGMQTFFRGPFNHPKTARDMNNIQRDQVKGMMKGFRTDSLNGKHERNLHTNHMMPGKYIELNRPGLVVPTFDDLLRGLHHLPSGLDARGLTECLSWYLNFRDSFTPKLDLNVLHAQALIRALRLPLKPYGPQNLDCNALKEWKEKGRFEERKVYYESAKPTTTTSKEGDQRRTQMHMNLDDHEVKLDLTLPLRHVFTFPFLALHSVVAEAYKMGIDKAENRQAEREGAEGRQRLEAKWAARLAGEPEPEEETMDEDVAEEVQEQQQEAPVQEMKEPHRTSKRPITTQDLRILAPMPRKIATSQPTNGPSPLGHYIPTGPRPDATSSRYAQPFLPMAGAHPTRDYGQRAPSSAYNPDAAYGRRGYEAGRSTDQRDPSQRGGRPGARGRGGH